MRNPNFLKIQMFTKSIQKFRKDVKFVVAYPQVLDAHW
jgi:hypothetical protein